MPRPLSALLIAVADRQALAVVGDELADAVDAVVYTITAEMLETPPHEATHVEIDIEEWATMIRAMQAWRHARETLQ